MHLRLVPLLFLVACGPLSPMGVVPPGLVCDRITVPSVSLAESLAAATPGECVIVPSGTYDGPFVVPEDVSLVASDRAMVTLTGGDPVLTVRGGPKSLVKGLRIVTSAGAGIAIEPGPARVQGVVVAQAQKSALTVSCSGADCDAREVTLSDCELLESGTGLRVTGARVRVEGGRIAGQTGTSLSSGSGVVASAGARLHLEGVTVEANQNLGVLLDGEATRATLTGCTVRDNLGRGIWAQGQVAATAGEPTVSILGGEVSGNALLGIGARNAAGLVVRDVTVRDTRAVREPIDISRFEDIGDGVALFAGTTAATLENVTLQRNPRAQILADACGEGVKVAGSTMTGGLYRIVIQQTAATVEVDTNLVDTPGNALLVKAPVVELAP